MSDSDRSKDKPVSFRRGRGGANSPPPPNEAQEIPRSEGEEPGMEYRCKRFDCIQNPAYAPFVLRGAELDDPVCPLCNKGDKLEELEPVGSAKSRRRGQYGERKPGGRKGLLLILLLLLCLGGGAAFLMPKKNPALSATPNQLVLTSGTPQGVFFISNTGKALLSGTASASGDWMTLMPSRFDLQPGGKVAITVSTSRSDVAGDLEGKITLSSNDPKRGKLDLPVVLKADTMAKKDEEPIKSDNGNKENKPPQSDEPAFVWTRPMARILSSPEEKAPAVDDNVPPFSSYAILDTRDSDSGGRWYRVGETSPKGGAKPLGWMKEEDVLPQLHRLVANFSNGAHRDKLLVFGNSSQLQSILKSAPANRSADYNRLYQEGRRVFLEHQPAPKDFPLVAIEPDVAPEVFETFYVMPILRADQFEVEGIPTRIAKLAGSSLTSKGENKSPTTDLDIVFVMDTSGTMQPFIDEALSGVESMAGKLGDGKSRIRFGFVAYQDADSKPNIKYLTKNVTPSLLPAKEFVSRLQTVRANVETPDEHAEAVLDGLNDALNQTAWNKGAAKLVILIGDAPPLPKAFRDGIDISGLRSKADRSRVAIATIGISAPKYSKYHLQLKNAFAKLSVNRGADGSDDGEWTYLLNGDRAVFASQFKDLTASIIRVIREKVGDSTEGLPEVNPTFLRNVESKMKGLLADEESYRKNKETPTFSSGWASSKGLANWQLPVFQVCVFVTRGQLEACVSAFEQLRADPKGKNSAEQFKKVQEIVRSVVDPAASFGAPRELPYPSPLLETTWEELAEEPEKAEEFWNVFDAKVSFMKNILNEKKERWGPTHDNATEDEYVTPYPLDELP